MAKWVPETGRAKNGVTAAPRVLSLVEREEVGSAGLSDRKIDCLREGVVGNTLGVGGCIDNRWPGFGVWAVLMEQEADRELERRTSPMERCWFVVGRPPWVSKESRDDLGEGNCCCVVQLGSIRIRFLLATEGEGVY